MRTQMGGVVLIGALAWAFTQPAVAESRAEAKARAEELVREALHREIYGQQRERNALLREAAELDPRSSAARWHLGEIRFQRQWLSAEDLAQAAEQDLRLTRYRNRRDGRADTVADHLDLASWCERQGLDEQRRAHLLRVLDLEPNHAQARAALGFRRVGWNWVTAQEQVAAREAAQREAAALQAWRPRLEQIAKRMLAGTRAQQETARQRLAEIHDGEAVPAIEAVFVHDPRTSRVAIDKLGEFSSPEASLAIARMAVFSPWPEVRQAACVALRERPRGDFLPVMLASMSGAIEQRVDVARDAGGRLLYRHAFTREGQDSHELVILDTAYRRVARNGGSQADSLLRAMVALESTAGDRTAAVAAQNVAIQQLNRRIAWALNIVTEETIPADPESWWTWWNAENEVFVPRKETAVFRDAQEVRIVDRTLNPGLSSGGGSISPPMTCDCLVAGTPVWTAAGPRPIEQLQVGDLIVCQDPESGETALKPMVRATVRPPETLVVLHVGDETITCSGGHPFWVAGEGWVKAREIRSGMELHTLGGTSRVSEVAEGSRQTTYNLVVADFHSYFVGESKVLSHDNTRRRPVDAVTPGLAR